MRRVTSICVAGTWDGATAIDRVTLDAGDRTRRRIAVTGERGTRLLIDFEKPASLRHGDGLVLEDGSIVLVAGENEKLAEITAPTPREFVRLAWHLGNRHTDVQIDGSRIRIRRDHVLEEMLRGLGASVAPVDAPFDPQATVPHSHAQDHAQDHGHAHGHHHGDRHDHDHD